MIYESHLKKNSFTFFFYCTKAELNKQQLMKTHWWLLASLSCVWFFLGCLFFPLSQVMTGTIWTDFWSTIFVFFCVQNCLRETLRTSIRSAAHSVHSYVFVLCRQSLTESSNSKIDSGSFRQDLLVLLSRFDNSWTY